MLGGSDRRTTRVPPKLTCIETVKIGYNAAVNEGAQNDRLMTQHTYSTQQVCYRLIIQHSLLILYNSYVNKVKVIDMYLDLIDI